MSARLPQPGSDDGTWGTILNDFLSVAHNGDGTLQNGIITDATIAATAAIARTKLDASTQASLHKADTALQSAPVTSVNAKTGAVTLVASDVGADASGAAAAAQAASLQISNNLSDLNSASTARTNLGLGDSATLNVGTIAGTVAAGNDSRLTAASTAVQSVNGKTGTSVTLAASDVGAIKGTEATTAPSSPATNDLWYDSTNDLWKRWNGSAWVISDSSNTYTAAGQIRVGTGSGQSELLPKTGIGSFLRTGGADPSGLEWGSLTNSDSVTIIGNLMTSAGQLIVGVGNGSSEILGPGSNGQILTADSTQGAGVAWKTLQAGIMGSTAYASSVTLPTAMTALDTTNLTLTFTAPASGKVLLRASFEFVNNGTYSSNVSSLWYAHGTTATITAAQQLLNFNGNSTGGEYVSNMRLVSEQIVTGLTSGQSYTYDLAAHNANASTSASDFMLTAWAA